MGPQIASGWVLVTRKMYCVIRWLDILANPTSGRGDEQEIEFNWFKQLCLHNAIPIKSGHVDVQGWWHAQIPQKRGYGSSVSSSCIRYTGQGMSLHLAVPDLHPL